MPHSDRIESASLSKHKEFQFAWTFFPPLRECPGSYATQHFPNHTARRWCRRSISTTAKPHYQFQPWHDNVVYGIKPRLKQTCCIEPNSKNFKLTFTLRRDLPHQCRRINQHDPILYSKPPWHLPSASSDAILISSTRTVNRCRGWNFFESADTSIGSHCCPWDMHPTKNSGRLQF